MEGFVSQTVTNWIGRIVASYRAIAKGVFFPSEPRVTSCALGSGQIPQRQEFRLVIANLHSNLSMKKRSVNRLKEGEEP
jgi:hypothetical protein